MTTTTCMMVTWNKLFASFSYVCKSSFFYSQCHFSFFMYHFVSPSPSFLFSHNSELSDETLRLWGATRSQPERQDIPTRTSDHACCAASASTAFFMASPPDPPTSVLAAGTTLLRAGSPLRLSLRANCTSN